jgi:hypothetical protein
MAGTVRELDFKVITFVSLVFILSLVIIVAFSVAWFRTEIELAKERTWRPNIQLVDWMAEQNAQLTAPESGVPITEAMRDVAARY